MKKTYYLITLLLVFLTACEDDLHYDKEQEDKADNFIGQMCSLKFDIPMEGFEEREAVLYISAPDGSVITRKCSHSRENGVSTILLEKGLKDGIYRLLYLEYNLPKPLDNGRITKGTFGLGCQIGVKDLTFDIHDSYNRDMEMFGEGTEQKPFIIASDYDVRTLAKKVNDSRYNEIISTKTFFKQYADIDLSGKSFDCDNIQGWSPIGTNNTVPFRGVYDGGNKLIKGLNIERYQDNGVGLFGFTVGAYIKNVRIGSCNVKGNVAVGALIGSITTAGGKLTCTVVDSCKLETGANINGTGAKGGLSTGGLIGNIDMNAKAIINACATDTGANVSSCFNAGGIVGTTSIYSALVMSNCINRAKVTSQYSGCGGMIASGDTIMMSNCQNYGDIIGSTLYSKGSEGAGIGTGGLIGGSGIAVITSSVNHGNIEGKEGVGGIIGSTRINGSDEEGYIYNNVTVLYCGNEGRITGERSVGGICGEAQFGSYGSYNTGEISGGIHTGGIAGSTAISVVHNTVNTGTISGDQYTGGIVGKTNFGQLAINHNYGTVKGSGSHAGGILALGSNNTMINYCGNHGPVTAGGDGPVGGIVGEIGDPSDWDLMNTADCIIGSVEIISGIFSCGFAYYTKKNGREPKKVLLRIQNSIDHPLLIVDSFFWGWSVYDMATFDWSEKLNLSIKEFAISSAESIKTKLNSLRREYGNFSVSPFYSEAFSSDYLNNVEALEDYYSYSDANAENFNNNINQSRYNRAKKLEKFSMAMEGIHATIAGICIIGGFIAAVGAGFVTGGTAPAAYLMAVGGISSIIGGANTIWKTTTDFEENAVIISQCVNTGYIESANNYSSKAGGIAGLLHDYSIIRDCLNSGNGNNSKGGGHFAGTTKVRTQVNNSLTIANIYGWYDIFDDTPPLGSYKAKNLYYCSNSENQTSVPTITLSAQHKPSKYADGLSNDEVEDQSSYKNWDFTNRWIIPAKSGSFPIPYMSEYQSPYEEDSDKDYPSEDEWSE